MFETALRGTTLIVGVLVIGFGFVVMGRQAFAWLQQGVWQPLTIGDAWVWTGGAVSHGVTSWRGVQKLIDWALAAPLSGGAVAAGCALLVFSVTNLLQYVAAVMLLVYIASVFW